MAISQILIAKNSIGVICENASVISVLILASVTETIDLNLHSKNSFGAVPES